ncbi:MAG TPA: hypothetical protein VE988_27230 [Gemmataceae bacterium]|nr:hypothetical protein [Gemmataceae bacterium]
MDKQRKKAMLKTWKHAERTDLLASMPITPQIGLRVTCLRSHR